MKEEHRIYLDTSAIAKRYVKEAGTGTIDNIFEEAESGRVTIGFSSSNISETLDVLLKRFHKKEFDEKGLHQTVEAFLAESLKLFRLRSLQILPPTFTILVDCWTCALKHKIYTPDALQIATAKAFKADSFLTFDERLKNVAEAEGLDLFRQM